MDDDLVVMEMNSERVNEIAPANDCCSICHGTFTIPFKSQCNHWFCGDCIMLVWHHGAALQPCRCPICRRYITRLTPETSLPHLQDPQAMEVLEKVQKYNRCFVGGLRGFLQRVLDLPVFLVRIIREMMDPDRFGYYFYKVRFLALFLSMLYNTFSFDFIPSGSLGIVKLFDYTAIAMAVTLYLVGIYRNHRRYRRQALEQSDFNAWDDYTRVRISI
ncbi:Zinc finger, C3HC4 RING-type [Dillenia turbinata]|uniref:Zinc finger, C3HC4 RING-type n=1 Tax=Dillenia turbinata TaxID=194707 RepID=A0AAN8UR75_9MAGN